MTMRTLCDATFWICAAVAVALCVGMAAPAAGQVRLPCAARSDYLGRLWDGYKERPAARGLANNGAVIEVLTTADGSTWTMVIVLPDGTACVMASGEWWQPVDPPALDPDA